MFEHLSSLLLPRKLSYRRIGMFQSELVSPFADAESVIVAKVARLEQLAAEERLNPEKLMQDLKAAGKNADYLFDVDAIVMHTSKNVQGGDVVVVFSNGCFDGIQEKLMERLAAQVFL